MFAPMTSLHGERQLSNKKSASPIVIYRLGSLGDTIVSLPCFHQIARTFHGRKRIVLTNEPVSSAAPALQTVLGGSGLIDDVITYTISDRSFFGMLRLMLKLRAVGTDTMVYLTAGRGLKNVRRDLMFFRLCGMRKIIGAPNLQDLHDNRREGIENHIEPEAERLARTITALGHIDLNDRANWDLRITDSERVVAADALGVIKERPFLAFNIGTKMPINHWGRANWSALLAELAQPLGSMALVGIGTTTDLAPTQRLLNHWPGPTVNLCGSLSPRESAAALSHARIFVGHDSGPMHLSAAMGTPTIGLFGNNNLPRKWHPYGPGNFVIHDVRGMEYIRVAQVRDAVLQLLLEKYG
jgi:heptosyltransferase-3